MVYLTELFVCVHSEFLENICRYTFIDCVLTQPQSATRIVVPLTEGAHPEDNGLV